MKLLELWLGALVPRPSEGSPPYPPQRRGRERLWRREPNVVDRSSDLDSLVRAGERLHRAPTPAAGSQRRYKVDCLRVHAPFNGYRVDRPQPAAANAHVLTCRVGRSRREEALPADAVQLPAQRICVQRASHAGHLPARVARPRTGPSSPAGANGEGSFSHVVPFLPSTIPARLAQAPRTRRGLVVPEDSSSVVRIDAARLALLLAAGEVFVRCQRLMARPRLRTGQASWAAHAKRRPAEPVLDPCPVRLVIAPVACRSYAGSVHSRCRRVGRSGILPTAPPCWAYGPTHKITANGFTVSL
jgi:hypothetical protein